MSGYDRILMEILNSKLAQDIQQAFDAGVNSEQERIIKVLEKDIANCYKDPEDCEFCKHSKNLIEIIRLGIE